MDRVTQDAVFRSQVCVAQAQFLIHRSRAIRKELLPIHGSFHPSCCLSLVGSMGHAEMECKIRGERWEDGKEWENGVAYPLAADNVSRPLVRRLKGLHQPVVRSRIRLSAPRSRLRACL